MLSKRLQIVCLFNCPFEQNYQASQQKILNLLWQRFPSWSILLSFFFFQGSECFKWPRKAKVKVTVSPWDVSVGGRGQFFPLFWMFFMIAFLIETRKKEIYDNYLQKCIFKYLVIFYFFPLASVLRSYQSIVNLSVSSVSILL